MDKRSKAQAQWRKTMKKELKRIQEEDAKGHQWRGGGKLPDSQLQGKGHKK